MADDWRRSVNKCLVIVGCTNVESVRFVTHLLEGPTSSWWENYQVTHPIGEVTCLLFQEAFHTTHVSAGTLSPKKREFKNPRQSGRSIASCVKDFNYLARYAPEDVKTGATRRERFMEGLNDEIELQLATTHAPTYQAMVDMAIIIEDKKQLIENHKRKYGQHKN